MSSSVEVSEDEDEELIIANMEKTSGLPQNYSVSREGEVTLQTMESDTTVASVKMMGGVIMNQSGNFADSDSEEFPSDDDITDNVKRTFNETNSNYDQPGFQEQESSRSSTVSSSKTIRIISTNSKSTVNGSDFHTSAKMCAKSDSFSSSASLPKGENSTLTASQKKYQEDRFNPFDRDLPVEEDHFNVNTRTLPGRLKSDSTATNSSSWTDVSNPVSNASDDITFADLGLSEDHFCQPEGYFGMSSTEELEMAIETCKDMIKQATPHSDKQKNLVKKLVQLRLKLQELKEGPEPVEEGVKLVVGHRFELRNSNSSKHFCEKCNAVIWGMLQEWYKCTECGYCSHEKCLNQITRTCASVKVQEDPTYCLCIRPDHGLSSQNYRCSECRASISYKSGFSEPRICDYSGNYLCELCHWNDTMVIPARVLHNWDFEPRKVCRASKQFLKLMENKAVIRIQDINPMLFSYVDELNEVKKLREELLIMKKYILICSFAMDAKLLLQLQTRQHFVESSDIYSMKDLTDVQNDSILTELAKVHSNWAQHIKTDCALCKAKGFICELCDVDEILFPFDNIAVVCSDCSSVLHRHCFAKKGVCPRCERRNKRQAQ